MLASTNGSAASEDLQVFTASELRGRFWAYIRGEITPAELDGVDLEVLYQWADDCWVLLGEGQLDKALAVSEALAGYHTTEAYFHTLRGAVLQRSGRLEDAIAAYEDSLSQNAEDITALTNMAESYLILCSHHHAANNADAARSAFEKAVRALERVTEIDGFEDSLSGKRAQWLIQITASLREQEAPSSQD